MKQQTQGGRDMNMQAPERARLREDGKIEIHSVWPTIQGEGPFSGVRSVFVRLAGCNHRCPLCDTDYTSKRKWYVVDGAVFQVSMIAEGGLVVITGGEPYRQNIAPFVTALIKNGYFVQIETNGVYPPPLVHDRQHITCSPKSPSVNSTLTSVVDTWKYVLKAGEIGSDGLPTRVLGYDHAPARPPTGVVNEKIWLQPCDERDEEKNKRNRDAVMQSAMKFGYRVGVQLHKIYGLA